MLSCKWIQIISALETGFRFREVCEQTGQNAAAEAVLSAPGPIEGVDILMRAAEVSRCSRFPLGEHLRYSAKISLKPSFGSGSCKVAFLPECEACFSQRKDRQPRAICGWPQCQRIVLP